MFHNINVKEGERYFCGADIGWVVGHSFSVYGPLLMGCSTIVYEGKPTTPNAGIFWQLIEKYKINGFYTAPTALRAIRKEDPDEMWVKKYDVSSLRTISLAGERCDSKTMEWLLRNFKNTFINDTYWQTESGLFICSNYHNLHSFPIKIGSCTKPSPGFNVCIIDDNYNFCKKNDIGKIHVKLPLPPSFMPTLWNNDKGFIER
jgi:propionyl-CoA synthetase